MFASMILLGTSGYSYKDWIGPVYPRGTRPEQMLELYAERFRTVEINATYYRLPGRKTFEGMLRRVPRDFRFAVKLPGDVTHHGKLDIVHDFRAVTQPLADAGQLACVLAQFPMSFRNGEQQRAYLSKLAGEVTGARVVVEFRHASWQVEPVYAYLRDLGLSVASVDAPDLPGLPRGHAQALGRVGYLRFHGRNAAQWFEHERAEQRYDYLYAKDELAAWIERIRMLEAASDELFIYFNNHFEGKAATNALQLAELLGEPLPMRSGRLFS